MYTPPPSQKKTSHGLHRYSGLSDCYKHRSPGSGLRVLGSGLKSWTRRYMYVDGSFALYSTVDTLPQCILPKTY